MCSIFLLHKFTETELEVREIGGRIIKLGAKVANMERDWRGSREVRRNGSHQAERLEVLALDKRITKLGAEVKNFERNLRD